MNARIFGIIGEFESKSVCLWFTKVRTARQMAKEIPVPFSARNQGAHAQIDNGFPETARIGLFHLLDQLTVRNYVESWKAVNTEFERIFRVPPSHSQKSDHAWLLVTQLDWDKLLDFCERLHSHLASEVGYFDNTEYVITKPKSEVQEFITQEIQRIFLEEHLAFEFSDGLVRRRGRHHTADQIARAEMVLGDSRLSSARMHANKALRYFRSVSQPDPENVVKEAVCAVEAAARALFPAGGNTLGDVVKSITGSGPGQLPKPIANTFHGLYGMRSGGDGVGHGGATGGPVTKELAEYALAVAASQIVLLVDLEKSLEVDVPF